METTQLQNPFEVLIEMKHELRQIREDLQALKEAPKARRIPFSQWCRDRKVSRPTGYEYIKKT
jgi:hypothetical protein